MILGLKHSVISGSRVSSSSNKDVIDIHGVLSGLLNVIFIIFSQIAAAVLAVKTCSTMFVDDHRGKSRNGQSVSG